MLKIENYLCNSKNCYTFATDFKNNKQTLTIKD